MYSNGFKVNVNKLNSDENILVLVKIEHPFISEPIRLVNDNINFTLEGEEYIAMPFNVSRQSDHQNELPKVSLEISNVGRSLVKWIDSSSGGRNAIVTIILARRSNQIIEEEITFGISSVSVTSLMVKISLVIQNNLTKRAIRFIYDTKRAPGLF